jgi:hypothetical protein
VADEAGRAAIDRQPKAASPAATMTAVPNRVTVRRRGTGRNLGAVARKATAAAKAVVMGAKAKGPDPEADRAKADRAKADRAKAAKHVAGRARAAKAKGAGAVVAKGAVAEVEAVNVAAVRGRVTKDRVAKDRVATGKAAGVGPKTGLPATRRFPACRPTRMMTSTAAKTTSGLIRPTNCTTTISTL